MTAGRILHLFANYKWTGPADPAIRTAAWSRRLGRDVVFAQAGWTLPEAEHRMAAELLRWRLPVWTGLELRKHVRLRPLLGDVRRLRQRLVRDPVGVVHCHLDGDHLLAALALRGLVPRPLLVRSLYDPDGPSRSLRRRAAFAATDGVVVPTRTAERTIVETFGFAAERVLYQDPPTEPHRRERAGGAAAAAAFRSRLGLTPDQPVVGITARVQPHRQFQLLWQTARVVADRCPEVRFVLLGRGNERDTQVLVREPVAALGLENHVVWPGYLHEPHYTRALCALDAFVFLVPGSDGTCRAVREAMGLGLPVVATRRGILPELLGEYRTDDGEVHPGGGVCCEETPDALGGALLRWIADPDARRAAGAAAARRAATAMDPGAAAARLLRFYDHLVRTGGRR